MSADTAAMRSAMQLHVGIAETGKMLALKGKHTEALKHYREAMRLAVSMKAPEVFFRHYTQCTLESLELTGSYDDVIAFCENAIEHYQTLATDNSLIQRDYASHLERLGVVLLKSGDQPLATEKLQAAVAMGGSENLPVAATLLGWLQRGIVADARRIKDVQKKHRYFTVRADQVDASRAQPLPRKSAPAGQAASHFMGASLTS